VTGLNFGPLYQRAPQIRAMECAVYGSAWVLQKITQFYNVDGNFNSNKFKYKWVGTPKLRPLGNKSDILVENIASKKYTHHFGRRK